MLRRVGALLGCLIVACSASTTSSQHVEPSLAIPTLAPAAAASAAPGARPARAELSPDLPDAVTWLDERILDLLALDCRWRSPATERSRRHGREPLSCALEDRSGAESTGNLCFEEMEAECKPQCARACHGCASGCVRQCESCKSDCSDDTCRRACAVSCARCRQECVAGVDRCQASECATRYRDCTIALTTELKKPACKVACGVAYRCGQSCLRSTDSEACYASCRESFSARCDPRFFDHCVENGS